MLRGLSRPASSLAVCARSAARPQFGVKTPQKRERKNRGQTLISLAQIRLTQFFVGKLGSDPDFSAPVFAKEFYMNGPVLLLALLQVRTQDRIFEYFTPARIAIAIVTFVAAWLTIRYVSKLLDIISVRSARIRFLSKLVEPVLRILLWFVAILLSFDLLAPTQE